MIKETTLWVKIWQATAIMAIIALFSLVLFAPKAHADMFPTNAKSGHFEKLTNGSVQILATTTARTILSFSIDADGTGSQVGIYCSASTAQVDTVNDIYENHSGGAGGPVDTVYSVAKCYNQPISLKFTGLGAKGGHAYLTWVDYDIASSTTASGITTDGGTISFLLLVVIFTLFLMVVGFLYNNMTAKKPWR